MKFTKYQGLGNDFIILDVDISEKEVKKLCDRHFGIGADGVIINSMKNNLPYMKFFNADGSRAKMCGNGIRCFADYLCNKGIDFSNIYTLAGVKTIEKIGDKYKVFMGKASEKFLNKQFLNETLHSVYTGTEHCVVLEDRNIEYVKKIGPIIENEKTLFPTGTNVNFVKIEDKNNIKVYTYERGVGITLACGTGACASTYIANKLGLVNDDVTVKLLGGNLQIQLTDKGIYMIGEAKKVFEGEI